MRKVITAACALAISFAAGIASAQEAPQSPATPEGWRALALSDLEAARDVLRTQTPIPYDTINPAYPAWLDEGFNRARGMAERARDYAGHFYAISFYLHGFNDPHISADPAAPLPPASWPGFIASSRDGGAKVVMRDESDPDAPQVGAQILSCEGRTLEALASERLYPFVINGRVALDRRRAIARLFLERGIPGAPAPSNCRFSIDGREVELALRWRPLPEPVDSYWTTFQSAAVGAGAEWGVTEAAPGVFWVGVPTFNSGEETAPRLEQLVHDIEARADAMRAGRAIVIDVRGNGGGNSTWADRIAAAIFSERVANRAHRAASNRSAIDWRASPENIAYWRDWINTIAIPEFGENSEAVDFGRNAIAGMERALGRNPPLWRQGSASVSPGGGLTTRRPRGASPFPARVYLLSNGTCGSSCLNFADTVLFVPGVQLIGSATSGDGPYMEVRNVSLPSGLVQLTIPQKVWRGMPRGPLEAYEPDIAYDGAWDDASVRAWVMERIAAQ
jgi:hypothetical protein